MGDQELADNGIQEIRIWSYYEELCVLFISFFFLLINVQLRSDYSVSPFMKIISKKIVQIKRYLQINKQVLNIYIVVD